MPTLTNVGSAYDTIMVSRELGIGRRDFRGYTHLDFDVYYQKVGTGVMSFQLFNMTDNTPLLDSNGNEIVLTDNGPTGIKVLSNTFTITRADTKLLRVRAKSTVAGDDPIYLGASVLLRTA